MILRTIPVINQSVTDTNTWRLEGKGSILQLEERIGDLIVKK